MKDERIYLTEEQKEALEALANHLEKQHKEWWEQVEKNGKPERKAVNRLRARLAQKKEGI